MEIGFIGLGNMGAPMARNLAAAGHGVTGFDVTGVRVEGVAPAGSAAEAARGREAVITMLPSGAIVREVYGGIVPAGAPGARVHRLLDDRRRERPRGRRGGGRGGARWRSTRRYRAAPAARRPGR